MDTVYTVGITVPYSALLQKTLAMYSELSVCDTLSGVQQVNGTVVHTAGQLTMVSTVLLSIFCAV